MDKQLKNKIVKNVQDKLMGHNVVNESIKEINKALDLLLKEDLSFANNYESSNNANETGTYKQKPVSIPQQEEKETVLSPNVKPMINNIRKIALEGIRELSDNSTSDEYVFFKKVWDMADKVQETKKENIQKN